MTTSSCAEHPAGCPIAGPGEAFFVSVKSVPKSAALGGSDLRLVDALVRSLALVIELRDKQTGLHCRMVGGLVARTATMLDVSPAERRIFRLAGELHDLGKIAIPDRLLHNKDELDAGEWKVVRAHAQHGGDVLAELVGVSEDIDSIAKLVVAHHEHWNGHGYPNGMAGIDIPLGARIISVCDAYSSLVMSRSYRSAVGHREALKVICAHSGTSFDPGVLAAFESLDWSESDLSAPRWRDCPY